MYNELKYLSLHLYRQRYGFFLLYQICNCKKCKPRNEGCHNFDNFFKDVTIVDKAKEFDEMMKDTKNKTPMEILTGKEQTKDWLAILFEIIKERMPELLLAS